MSTISIDVLNAGMVIKEDIFAANNQLVVCKNTFVTNKILDRLKYFDIKEVCVYDDGESIPTKQESFDDLKNNYNNIQSQIQSTLDDVIKSTYNFSQINNLLEETINLYNNQSSINILTEMINKTNSDDAIFIHSLNVGLLSMSLAKWLGMSDEECKLILQCGLFHDVGKLLIPKSIINKNDKLSINEFAQMKSHTIEGYNLLKSLNMDEEICNTALLHHERIDGSGYPLQLHGSQINKFSNAAKIVAIVDTYVGMTSKRNYRDAFSPFSVFAKFECDGIKLFEPLYLITFLKKMTQAYINKKVLLTNNIKGTIVMINDTSLSRPIIEVEDGNFIDLAQYKESELTISKIL